MEVSLAREGVSPLDQEWLFSGSQLAHATRSLLLRAPIALVNPYRTPATLKRQFSQAPKANSRYGKELIINHLQYLPHISLGTSHVLSSTCQHALEPDLAGRVGILEGNPAYLLARPAEQLHLCDP